MSRIIIKNLPKGAKEEQLRTLFSQKGQITDISMKYTKDGIFRNFAFIGYKTDEEAEQAIKHFDKTFFNSTRMQVQLAKDFGDQTKPRAWSKYSTESSANQQKMKRKKKKEQNEGKEKLREKKTERKKKVKEEKLKEILGDLGDDPEFQEFLEVHKKSSDKSTWNNDAAKTIESSPEKKRTSRGDETFDASSSASSEEEDEDEDERGTVGTENQKKKTLSDLEYLKSMMTGSVDPDDSSSAESEDSDSEVKSKVKGKKKQKKLKDKGSDKGVERGKKSVKGDNSGVKDGSVSQLEDKPKNVIKIRGLGKKYNEKTIKEFFQPLNVVSVKIPRNVRGHRICVAYVEFSSPGDVEQALKKDKNMLGGKQVHLKKAWQSVQAEVQEKQMRPWEMKIQQDRAEEDEGIAETGRLFVRNLAYCCTEEEIENLFKKYGPLTEVNVPVDKFSKRVKGFAQVTFMIPEHAVKAFVELDGTVFQGRMLHILPGKPKTEEMELLEKSSFKKKKELEQKNLAKSSHNWNSLFLGANAVADAMAERYATSKSQILDAEGKESLGVRMALGETQIVSETRNFLVENGVVLDSFSQPATVRSKTVILAKNLPAGTQEEELREKFEKFGTLGRLLLPPSGVSALIEFLEPSEARAAFMKLAYTKFHYLPLYLEWAPMGVFTSDYSTPADKMEEGEEEKEDGEEEAQSSEVTKETTKPKTKTSESESEEEEEQSGEPGCTVFVKNLNFKTTEETLAKVFQKCGKVKHATISKKKDFKNPDQLLSMGYGFVEYKKKSSADKAMKTLQHVHVDDHQLELKISHRTTQAPTESSKKKQKSTKQKSTKILVRNIPFEASRKEIHELFRVFGELKIVRLPKKLSGTGSHRGFGFVDFLTRQDAKRAFNALCHSTHLYGRRLVLEWADAEETIDNLRKKTAEHFYDDVPSKKLKKSAIMEQLKS